MSWALVGGKGFHRATEAWDLARLCRPTNDEPPVRSVPTAGIKEIEGLPNKQSQEHGKRLNTLAAQIDNQAHELASLHPDVDTEVRRHFIRELWESAFEYEIEDTLFREWKNFSPNKPGVTLPDPKGWKAAGRPSKAWPEKENGDWWKASGFLMLERYTAWIRESGWEVAFLNSTPAIELDVAGELGTTPIQGYLDRVMLNPAGQAVLVDLKSNSREPSDPEQLGFYAVLLELNGYPRPDYGTYWMSRKGDVGDVHALGRFTVDYFQWKYDNIKKLRDSGVFFANTKSQFCGSCSVADYCYAVNGPRANEVPRPWESRIPVGVTPINTRAQ